MNDLDKMTEELIEEMKEEAVQRLETVKPDHPALAEEFRKDGTVYVQDISTYCDEKDRLRKADKIEMDLVHYIEDQHAVLPYLIVKNAGGYEITYSTIYYIFYVNWNKSYWSIERSSLQKHGKPYMEPYVFEVNAGLRTEDDESPIDTLLSRFTMTHFNLG